MDETFIDYKLYSYMARMSLAMKVGDKPRAKKAALLAVVLARMQARDAVNELVSAREDENAANRAVPKARKTGTTFLFGEQRLKQLAEVSEQKRKALIDAGGAICTLLDRWQSYGATLAELCNLCNKDHERVLTRIKAGDADDLFPNLVFVYNLDYKDPRNRGWIDFDVDAPMTHAVKEFWIDLMLHTEEGRKASHEALVTVFPEIMENALTVVADPDGVKRVIDKDGVEVGTVEEGG